MNEGVKSSVGTPERYAERYDTAKAERIETALPARNGTFKAERFETVREIGRGGSSIVYLVKDTQDGKLYAMKLVNENMMSSEGDGREWNTSLLRGSFSRSGHRISDGVYRGGLFAEAS